MNKLLVILWGMFICSFSSVHAKTLVDLEQLYDLDRGFVNIIYDKKEDKIYLKIDNLGQDFIYQTSLPNGIGSNDIGLDRGQLGNTRLAVFEKVGNKVFLKQKPTFFRAETKNKKEALAVEEAFASSILWGFKVVDSGKNWVLVDASDFILQDIHAVGRLLERKKQGVGFKVDKSRSAIYMPRTTSFPDNTELEATITLVGKKPGVHLRKTVPDPHAITLKMHHSFVRLPDRGYKPRIFHPKSGYRAVEYRDYAQPIGDGIAKRYIARHRLEKKKPKANISEAVKPIIYYLDPGVPEPVKSALIEGAMWWNQAFEAIGYKDAFQVKMLPSYADPMDVRYNVIQWVHRSTRGWSYGSSVTDPRTGEIIKGHVTLGSLRVRQDYLIAQGMMAPFAQDEEDEALMNLALARIRQLSAHEVGHTIGIKHNFASSGYGRESVMDYPHPQFTLNGNKIGAPNAYAVGMGKWDKAVIAYGYQEFEPEEEVAALKQIIAKSDKEGLLFISDADARSPGSPHAQASLWDNGSDAVAELENMYQLRSTALTNFGAKSLKRDRPWSDLQEILVPVYYFHRYQIAAASKWLGGYEYDYAVKRNNQPAQQKSVSGERQVLALNTMLKSLEPEFLVLRPELVNMLLPKAAGYYRTRESVSSDTGPVFDQIKLATGSAQHTLGLIFHPQRLARLIQQNAVDQTVPSIDSIATDIHQKVIEQNYDGIQASIHQSVVDLVYSNYLNLVHDKSVPAQVRMQVFGVLLKEKDYLFRKLTTVRKTSSYYGFYAYQSKRLEELSVEDKEKLIDLPKMPPGSPI
ncbi:zinc-dependent metalloprotease [Aliikangiella sp. IMCC44359]|uniref:zinc-dependent metalloprotease n=1 Tax=Aliikangiella sp. IMCC44359 TaxID=3459125 RepID=UPI00403B14AF